MKHSNLKNLNKIAALFFLLIPLPNSKIFVINGIAITFQFFNLLISTISAELTIGHLNEILLLMVALSSVILMLKEKLFRYGSTCSLIYIGLIAKVQFITKLDFLVPMILYTIILLYINISITRKVLYKQS